MNNHCDFVSIEKAYDLMDKLGIKNKKEFAKLCNISPRQFTNWEKKGRMPEYKLSTIQKEIIASAKKRFDQIVNAVLND